MVCNQALILDLGQKHGPCKYANTNYVWPSWHKCASLVNILNVCSYGEGNKRQSSRGQYKDNQSVSMTTVNKTRLWRNVHCRAFWTEGRKTDSGMCVWMKTWRKVINMPKHTDMFSYSWDNFEQKWTQKEGVSFILPFHAIAHLAATLRLLLALRFLGDTFQKATAHEIDLLGKIHLDLNGVHVHF